ncbi:MAG: peptidase [Phycisphaerales bacterium]|nr:peptidase [Phycisphaerales bacterium]
MIKRILLLAWLSGTFIATAPSLARAEDQKTPAPMAQAAVAPIEFETETLDNGLRVVYAPLRQAPVVHVRVFYHVGSKDEKPDRQGFAHMFEHMMFRGSAHVKPEQHMQLINGVGGISNAFTSFDQTTYVDTVPREATEMALWLEADRMASFKVTDEIYQIERKVVAQEWAMRMNQPYGNLYEEFLKQAYAKHSYRWTPIGNMEHLKAAAVNELQDFFNTYYIPNNAILVVAGDIDVAKTKQWVHDYYNWIPKGPTPERLSPREPEQTEGKRAVVPANVPLPAVLVGVRIPAYSSDDQYAFGVLDEILGSGRSSRLSERLVTGKDPLCTEAQAMYVPLEDGGIFGVFGMLLAGKNSDDVEKVLREEMTALADKGVTAEELAKAKTQARLGVIRGRKTAENIAKNVGEEWLFGGDPNRANTELAKIDKLTVADVQAVAKKYLKAQRMTDLQMVPDPTGQLAKKAMAEARSTATAGVTPATEPVKPRVAQFPPNYPTQPPAIPAVGNAQFNKGEEAEVNGLKVVTVTDHRLPLAGFTLSMRRGSYNEPADKVGLAGLTAEMLRRGSGGIAYETFNQTLDAKGISIGVSDGGDHTNLVVTFPTDQLDEAVRLSRLVLQKPDFPQDQFDNLKAQAVNGLTAELASPTTVADREVSKLLYGDTPLGRNSTPKSLQSITVADVKDFYAKIYHPQEGILVVAGDVSADRGKSIAERLLRDWSNAKSAAAPAPKLDLPPRPTKRIVVLVDNPGAPQAAIRMGVPAFTTASDEKYAGALANQILSGGIESRIMRYVRAEKGLAYHAHGVFMPGRVAGAFVGQTGTQVDKAADAIEAMFQVLDQTRKTNVSDAELADAKRRVAGRMVMQMQTIDQQADRRLEGILNGYPADYYDKYAARVAAVTADQIREAMERYVDPAVMQVVVVAPADGSKEKLARLGEVKVEPMPGKAEELLK